MDGWHRNGGVPRPEIYYRLPCSTLLVSGSCETKPEWKTGHVNTTYTSSVSLFVEADPRHEARVRLPWHSGGTHDLSIKLAADGRPLLVSGSAKGVLGEAIATSVSLVAFVGGIAVSLLSRATPAAGVARGKHGAEDGDADGEITPGEEGASPPEAKWKAENPDGDATRLETAVRQLRDAHETLVRIAGEAGRSERPGLENRKLLVVRAAIAELESEIKAITARKDAWYAQLAEAETFRFTIPTDEIFRLREPTPHPAHEIDDDQLEEPQHGAGTATAILENLGVAVVDVTPTIEADEATIDDAEQRQESEQDLEHGDLAPAVSYRVPRPIILALYKRKAVKAKADAAADADAASKPKLELESAQRYWVIDRDSREGVVPLEGPNLKTAVTFTEAGVLETAAVGEESRLGEALEALGHVPDRVASAIGSAKTTVEALGSLSDFRAQQELDRVKRKKDTLEQQVAERGLEADASAPETLQQLKDRLDRLKTEKEIADLTRPAPTPTVDEARLADEKRLLEQLQVQVAIADAKAELAALSHGD